MLLNETLGAAKIEHGSSYDYPLTLFQKAVIANAATNFCRR